MELLAVEKPPYSNINNEELKKLLADGVKIYDIRRPGEWKQTGVVEGSRLLTLFTNRGVNKDFFPLFTSEVKKDEKVNLMHIAICKLLEPYGYYEFEYFDNDGWPHYKTLTELPNLKPGEQTVLMKEAIVNYFDAIEFFK